MKIKNRKPQTRKQRIAALRLAASISRRAAQASEIRELLRSFQVQTGFMMHNPSREYNDSDAAKALVGLGRGAMLAIANAIDAVFSSDDYGYTGDAQPHEWFGRTFRVWTFLVNDALTRVGRCAPYSGKTPYGYQDMRVYAAACRQCALGVPQAQQIHKPWAHIPHQKAA